MDQEIQELAKASISDYEDHLIPMGRAKAQELLAGVIERAIDEWRVEHLIPF